MKYLMGTSVARRLCSDQAYDKTTTMKKASGFLVTFWKTLHFFPSIRACIAFSRVSLSFNVQGNFAVQQCEIG
jgi:hypothetical protein